MSAVELRAEDYDPRLSACPACCEPALRRFDQDYLGHHIDRCANCGIKLMNPQYSDGYLRTLYSHYHPEPGAEAKGGYRRRRDVRGEGKRRKLVLAGNYIAPGRLLMIGCGDGLELTVARELGWDAEGYDVDATMVERVQAEFGMKVHTGEFEQLGLADASFDLLFLDQVLEHLKDPVAMLRSCRRLLRPGGMLYIGVPNIASLSNSLKTTVSRLGLRRERRGRHYATRHHLFYFSPASVRKLLEEQLGFEVVTLRGSLKPQRSLLTPLFSRWFPNLDSGFMLLVRRGAG